MDTEQRGNNVNEVSESESPRASLDGDCAATPPHHQPQPQQHSGLSFAPVGSSSSSNSGSLARARAIVLAAREEHTCDTRHFPNERMFPSWHMAQTPRPPLHGSAKIVFSHSLLLSATQLAGQMAVAVLQANH